MSQSAQAGPVPDGDRDTAPSGPIVVDLDGTLVRTDLLHEAVIALARESPWSLFRLPFWLVRGKAVLKQRVAERVPLDAAALPYEPGLVEWLRAERSAGRRIVLATASNRLYAQAVADHLGVFDVIISSDARTNLAGRVKRDVLVEMYGERRITYVGNARPDLEVWPHCAGAVLVNASHSVSRRAAAATTIERTFESGPGSSPAAWWRGVRAQQWLKNLLVFVPLVMSHRIAEPGLLLAACLAFLAFSLVASGGYILNDLLDLGADRRHPRKLTRPFAAGELQAWHGVLAMALLLACGIAVAWAVSPLLAAVTACYLLLSVCYSLWWKRIAVLDVVLLALLYTLRILAGAAAVMVLPSFWLLAFSVFVFLSLAVLKRFVELRAVSARAADGTAAGRGYAAGDLVVVSSLGVACGVAAALVLALYVDSQGVRELYSRPWLIWLVCPIFLYWIGRTWLKAHRGEVHDDPVVFALKDRTSLLVAVVTAGVFYLAA